MPTADDVAKLAGVSKMTVSRVLNNSGYVSSKTRGSVERAINELNFRPNMVAKALATKRTRIIAYAMVNISDPFHSLVAKGLEEICFKKNYTLILCDTNSKETEQDYLNMFIERYVDGVVFHHLSITEAQLIKLKDIGVNCLLMDNEKDLSGSSSIRTDNYGGAVMAIEHIISKGHRRIGCVHGVLKKPAGREVPYEDTFQFDIWRQRTKGFKDSMKQHGLDAGMLYQGNGLQEIMQTLTEQILDSIFSNINPPTAVYCENDIMALMLLSAMTARGLRSPDDLAIIGHDGLSICRLLHPFVTTIAQPQYRMGNLAGDLLIRQIEKASLPEKLVLSPSLLEGETT